MSKTQVLLILSIKNRLITKFDRFKDQEVGLH